MTISNFIWFRISFLSCALAHWGAQASRLGHEGVILLVDLYLSTHLIKVLVEQPNIWQVWTWTITSYPVHLGEEITINMLAGKLFYFSCLFWKKVQNVNFSVSSFREEWNKRLLPILWKEKFQTENYYLKRQAFYI